MSRDVRFERRNTWDVKTNRKGDEVVVIRDGREVAALPDASRLERAMSLPLEEAAWIAHHFSDIMHREPTTAENEFWQAVVDFKRSHAHMGSGAA